MSYPMLKAQHEAVCVCLLRGMLVVQCSCCFLIIIIIIIIIIITISFTGSIRSKLYATLTKITTWCSGGGVGGGDMMCFLIK